MATCADHPGLCKTGDADVIRESLVAAGALSIAVDSISHATSPHMPCDLFGEAGDDGDDEGAGDTKPSRGKDKGRCLGAIIHVHHGKHHMWCILAWRSLKPDYQICVPLEPVGPISWPTQAATPFIHEIDHDDGMYPATFEMMVRKVMCEL